MRFLEGTACKETYASSGDVSGRNWRRSTTGLTCHPCPAFRKDSVLSSRKRWRLASRLSRRAQRRPGNCPQRAVRQPESADALADAIEQLYGDSQLRTVLAEHGRRDVKSFDMRLVAQSFMGIVSGGVREMEIAR